MYYGGLHARYRPENERDELQEDEGCRKGTLEAVFVQVEMTESMQASVQEKINTKSKKMMAVEDSHEALLLEQVERTQSAVQVERMESMESMQAAGVQEIGNMESKKTMASEGGHAV